MSTESNETAAATRASFVKSICFHGLNLAVLNAHGIDYIPAKPLCELAGLDWKGAKRTLQSPDKVYLYDLKRLIAPHIEGLGGLKSPQEGVLCLRLERSRMYLAQISTERMRAMAIMRALIRCWLYKKNGPMRYTPTKRTALQ